MHLEVVLSYLTMIERKSVLYLGSNIMFQAHSQGIRGLGQTPPPQLQTVHFFPSQRLIVEVPLSLCIIWFT